MRDEDRQNENSIKILFFILTRINGERKTYSMIKEEE